jgi:xylose isomerase
MTIKGERKMAKKNLHSICAWTFHSGNGGFTPADIRPEWSASKLNTVGKIRLIKEKIMPRIPGHIGLGLEAHYDYEYNEANAGEIAAALTECGIALAMVTPGAQRHFGYGGICSLDPLEQKKAAEYGLRALDLAYGPLRKAWDEETPPTFVIWNGSFGYDLASPAVREMYDNLKKNIAALCAAEKKHGGDLFMAIEPKPNEGHPAMLLPTVASAILFWRRLAEEYGVDIKQKGINKEFGHSEMIGLDHVYDTVEEIDNNMLVHMHINSQGYNDGIILGGPGKYDIDHGARINGMNIAIASLLQTAGFTRWKGHDMQPRAYDSEEQAIDRVVRSILSWEACEQAAREFDYPVLRTLLEKRNTAKAEDMMRHAVMVAQKAFDDMYS